MSKFETITVGRNYLPDGIVYLWTWLAVRLPSN